jgi:hypothetical protein
MFRHIVMFRWAGNASDERRARTLRELARLGELVSGLGTLRVGTDAGLAAGNFDVVVTVDFAGPDGYLSYAQHPEHLRVIAEHIKPAVAARSAIQYQVS